MKKRTSRKIVKNGRGTYYVSIPKEMIKDLKFKERQKITLRMYKHGILIEDWKDEK